MPRIEVDTETLTAGGALQSAAGGQALEAAGELQAAIAAAAAAVGDAGAGGAVGGWGETWSQQPRRARRRDAAHGRQPHRGGPRVPADRRLGDAALMAGGESYGGITVPEGDPGALEASAGRLVATAGMLDSISGSLRGVLGGLSWFGPASAAHTGLTGAQSTDGHTASGSLIQKAAVINDYALVLEAAQRQAKKAIERAKDADRRIKEAKADIDQAITDQGTANARIIAAQAAQSRFFTSVVDFAFGDTAAAAAVDAAAAEEADARRDLEAAQERERIARRRLEEAQKDREDAQKDGDKAELAVELARAGLIAAAQGAGLLPTQPGGPADPAFAAAAGIRLEPPKPPPKDEGNWFERRLDDVGDAASWTWDQTKQVPGGFWEGTKGIGEGAYFLYQLNPTNPHELARPGRDDRPLQAARGDRPVRLREPGRVRQGADQLRGPRERPLRRVAGQPRARRGARGRPPAAPAPWPRGAPGPRRRWTSFTDAARAYDRASDISAGCPRTKSATRRRSPRTPGDDGAISISGEPSSEQARALERMGLDPDLLKTDAGARRAERDEGHRRARRCRRTRGDRNQPDG